MSIKNEIDRIKQNVADAYNVIEDQGVVVQDDKSDYLDENMEGLFSNLEALVTDETVTEAIDLDDYDIIDITRVNVVNKDRTITANGTYLPPEGYAGFGEIVVDVDVNNEERTFTQNGIYYPSPDKNGMGKVTVDTPYQGYLDDINTALTGLGITPPADYADIDTTITNSFGAILSELEDINGGTASNPLLDRITELEGYLNDIKTVLTNQGLTPPADYADLDTYINTAFNDIHNGLTDIHGES